MADAILSHPALKSILADVSQNASYDDVAALIAVGMVSAGYLSRGILWDKPDPYHYLWFERPQESLGGVNTPKETRNIAEKLEIAQKDLVIFWGSQSGTAEEFANRLARDCHRRFGVEALSADLSDFDPATIALIPKTKFAIFLLSTYGEGDPSDNTSEFWTWLRGSPNVSLSNLQYMAFGLGNKNYKFYNRVVDVVVEYLDKLGAKSLLPVGRADDSTGATEEDFMEWKESLFLSLRSDLGYSEREPVYEPTLRVVEDDSLTPIDLHHGTPWERSMAKKTATALSVDMALPVRVAKELFATPDRNCLHMELDLGEFAEVKYKTGDHLGVWPINPDIEVDRLLRVLGLQARRQVPLSITALEAKAKLKIPTPTTADALFRHYLEICGPVSRETVLSLAQFAPTVAATELLTTLGNSKAAYAQFLASNHTNIGRLLEHSVGGHGSWESLPLAFLIETLPAMHPRYYSIASSSVVQPRQAAITAVVSDTLLSGASARANADRIPGLATNYMLALKQSLNHESRQPHPHGLTYALNGAGDSLSGGKLYAHIRKSNFKLPRVSGHAMVMVAAGTGIAPFRAFLQERARLKSMDREVGRMILFFGCRHEDQDFLYREEIRELQRSLGTDLSVVTAFSRPGDRDGTPVRNREARRAYVQDRIAEPEHAEAVCRLLMEENAHFYICGSAAMARDVSNTVGAQLQARFGLDDDQLRAWSERQKRQNRWQEDVWG